VDLDDHADSATPPVAVFRHAIPRDVGATLALAGVLLSLLLALLVCRQCLSAHDGLKQIGGIMGLVASGLWSPDGTEMVLWPLGWLLVSVLLLGHTLRSLAATRRTLATLAKRPGAVVWEDRLEILVPRSLSVLRLTLPWESVTGARRFADPLNEASVIVRALRGRSWRLGPHLDCPEQLVEEITLRAKGGAAR
jgi:hypothetical protein